MNKQTLLAHLQTLKASGKTDVKTDIIVNGAEAGAALEGDIQSLLASAQAGTLPYGLKASTTFSNGAILIDEYDNMVFDDLRRNFPVWSRIDKRLAPGETTGGFDQTAIAAARHAAVRTLSFSGTSPTRSARTRRDIKAIVADLSFTMFDRSVYQQQGRRFGSLEQKDINDLVNACLNRWNTTFYTGDATGTPTQFDGLRSLVTGAATVEDTTSIVLAINDRITSMVNNTTKMVRPTAIYCNAVIQFRIEQELLKMGHKLVYAPIQVGQAVFQVAQMSTPVGMLPLIVDPFNASVAGTPTVYPTFIVSEDKLSWQYVEPLGASGPDPKTFEISLANDLDQEYKTVMFGALELLGGTSHHYRLNIEDRSTVVDPSA